MLLLSVTNVSRGYDAVPLFEEVSFELHAGERLGLVGPNGAGKTTLLKVIAGLDEPESGQVQLHAGAKLGLLSQMEEFAAGRTLFEEAKSAFDELLSLQEQHLATAEALANARDEAERRALADKLDRLTERLRHHDAFELDHKVEAVLSGLGFSPGDLSREVSTFSGGQQRRLLLAKLLLAAPDVMLLDEPSNHLDIRTTRWLEDYLVRQPEGMIIVSHDRYFLDKVVTKILELHERRITVYPGNYQQYVRLREERYERRLKEWEAQQEYLARQEEYIRRVHYGQLARQAQSRAKAIDKMERLEKPTRVEGPRIRFREVARSGDNVFHVDNLSKRFGDRLLFTGLSFDLQRGKRLGIMGPNGSGKTTLLKILLGEEEPSSGVVQRGHLVFPGYFDQHLHLLDDDLSVLRAAWPENDPHCTEQRMRDLLGQFGLKGEIVDQPVRSLSGGERSRAALARLTLQGVNLLVLDEPTNHLDIWACDALEEALRNFTGTAIVVSHDRYFLNRVVDLLIVLEGNGQCEVVYGNYETYERLRAERDLANGALSSSRPAPASPAPATVSSTKVKRKRKFPYRKAADIEREIAALEQRISLLESALVEPETYRNPDKLKQTMADLEQAKAVLPTLYEHWEEAMELNG